MVNQITVISILMIVQGALELLMGVVLVFMAFFMGVMLGEVAQQQQAQGGPDFPVKAFVGIYLAMGLTGFIPGVLHIIAGIRGLYFKSRTFGIISLIVGLFSIGTIYCSVTSVGLAVWGLIVYFSHDALVAFEMAGRGHSPAEIKRLYYLDPRRFSVGEAAERDEHLWEPQLELPPRRQPASQHDRRDQYYGDR